LGGQAFQATDDAVGVDGAVDVGGQRFSGELVDDVQELEHPPVTGLVELEVQRPDDVRLDRAHGPHGRPDAPQRFLAFLVGHPQAFGDPEAVDALVVGPPAGLLGFDGGSAPAPAGTATGEVPQPGPQGQLVVGGDRCGQTLGGPGLADHPAGPAL
jgi:hypothetical protein